MSFMQVPANAKYTIVVKSYGNDYDVTLDPESPLTLTGLFVDELLGLLARTCLLGYFPVPSFDEEDTSRPPEPEWELRISQVHRNGGMWTIQQGPRFTGPLTFEEMLGFVAAYALTGRELFGGMKTYEQKIDWYEQIGHPVDRDAPRLTEGAAT